MKKQFKVLDILHTQFDININLQLEWLRSPNHLHDHLHDSRITIACLLGTVKYE